MDSYIKNATSGDSKLSEVVAKIDALCAKFTGESSGSGGGTASSSSKEMTLEALFEVLGAFGAKTKEYFGRLAEEVVARSGVPSSQEAILSFSEELNVLSDKYASCAY